MSRSRRDWNTGGRRAGGVPLISVTSLYNRLQTSGLIVLDCRSYGEFRKSHLPHALHCDRRQWKHSTDLNDFVTRSRVHNPQLVKTMRHRDLLEIVVIASGSKWSTSMAGISWLYRLDWSYRLAKSLVQEGRVFSVKLLAHKFQLFQAKYEFLLQRDDRQQPTCITSVPLSLDMPSTTHDRHLRAVATALPATAPAPAPAPVPVSIAEPLALSPAPTKAPAPALAPASTCSSSSQQPVLTSFPSEILEDFLFLGNFWQANSRQVLHALGITHVVNVGAVTNERNRFEDVQYLDLTIQDKDTVDLTSTLAASVTFIQKARHTANARVLLHCVQGISRSSTIAIWYLMLTKRCTLSAAYVFVLQRRPLIFPNRGFMNQLMAKEQELYGTKRGSVQEDELELLQNGLLPPVDRKGSLLVAGD